VGPDVAVLDIEMPDLDGIAALPQLLAKKRDLVIIMASTLTAATPRSVSRRVTGRVGLIPKPESTREPAAAETFRHDLIQKNPSSRRKVRRPVAARQARHWAGARSWISKPSRAGAGGASAAAAPRFQHTPAARAVFDRRSTGGPQALPRPLPDGGPWRRDDGSSE